jgi:hypothetical protein
LPVGVKGIVPFCCHSRRESAFDFIYTNSESALRKSNPNTLENPMAEPVVKNSSPALIAVAWIIVLVPAAWGLTYTVQNALKIFTAPAPAAAPVSSPGK